jgi:exosortase D (VPLPA-CTERM-specific)
MNWKTDRKQILSISLLTLSFIGAYFTTITGLVHAWSTNEDYSYGFLIPLISAYLVWERRKELGFVTGSAEWTGLFPFLFFLAFGAYGILGSSPSAAQPSLPFVLLSIILLCFGWRTFKVLFFPALFLVFMIPLPNAIQTGIGVPLKLLSTKLGELFLRAVSIPVFVQGNVIDLGVTQLQVVDACSGLRYILPLLALGVLVAYFFEKTRWKQALLVVATIPVAVMTNGVRIGATGVLAQKYGPGAAEGFFHGFSGWLVFMFALVLIGGILLILKRVGGARGTRSKSEGDDGGSARPTGRSSLLPVCLCSCCLILLAGLVLHSGALPRIGLKGGITSFPMFIDHWSGRQQGVDPAIITQSGAEEALSAEYRDAKENSVSLYIGYRGSPFVESENFFHSPSVCLPSSGWDTIELSKRVLAGVEPYKSLNVTKMIIEQTGTKQLVYYWFLTKDRSSHNVNLNRFDLAMHALLRDNTYDMFIRPITPIYPGETVEQAEDRMDRFVRSMMRSLVEFLAKNAVPDRP